VNPRIILASLGIVPLLLAGLLALPRETISTPAVAQGTGSITGQVIWCSPLPLRAGVAGAEIPDEVAAAVGQTIQGQPPGVPVVVAPDGQVRPGPQPIPIPPPAPPRPIPAGAVLVAVQNTSLNARTDEGGNFRIDGVPVGQFYTVAAGPVRNAPAATAMRPNVAVNSGETVNLGQLALGGGPCAFPRPLPAGAEGAPTDAP